MSDFKIRKVEIIPIQIELNEPFVISVGAISHATNTVIRIHVNDNWGTGECCKVRTVISESQADVVKAARQIAPTLIGKDVREIQSMVNHIDVVHPTFTSAKAAFDIALYDLNAKILGLPLFRFLQGHNTKSIFTDMTVGLHEIEVMVSKAEKFVDAGFPSIKVKLGDKPSSIDVDRIKAIRSAVGMEIPIRIDANQGWDVDNAAFALKALGEYNIEYCEAPIHAIQVDDRAKLKSMCNIPFMGDECIFSPEDAYRNLQNGSIDMVNIKLGKSGGICQAMKIASITEAAGVSCQVGCFSESRLGLSALAHFSKVWDHIIYHDMDSALMHSMDPVLGGMTYASDWEVVIDEEAHGHGAHFDENFLQEFECFTFDSVS